MANSLIIGKAKNKIMREFIKNKELVQAIDSNTVSADEPAKLIRTHIFDYPQNPDTLKDVQTFIMMAVSIPEAYYRDRSPVFVKPRLEIWIISHENHMKVDNIPKVTVNRNDYIAEIIDVMLNGRDDFGIGKLNLISNIEGSHLHNYLYRTLIFEVLDVNDSLCE